MKTFKSLLPSLIALGTAALAIFAPALQVLIASHPAVSAVLAAVGTIVAHLVPSPFSASAPAVAPKQ
jgi:hypothetical protein